ncbi:MAG: glycosyltransferase [Ignavibacteria bacterium]|nr:glycosyltransferase [Ignavibacteria bacterium]
MFEIIFLAVITVYFYSLIFFTVGLAEKYLKIPDDELPSASIIVAARNEEKSIVLCLKSLSELNYPEGKLEIIIIDDNSQDKTPELIKEFISGKSNFVFLQTGKLKTSLTGKSAALAEGISKSRGEIILTTDADCTVGKNWAKNIVSYYRKDVGVVCGFTNYRTKNIFSSVQTIDLTFLLSVASGMMNSRLPVSAIGNNMSFRKSAYIETGGLEKLKPSVTEDYALIKAFSSIKKYKMLFPADAGTVVTSIACEDFKSLYHQKKRWAVGGMDSSFIGLFVMSAGWITSIMILISLLSLCSSYFLVLFKFAIDFLFLKYAVSKLKQKMNLLSFILFEIYFISYISVLPFVLIISRKVKWKEREY